MPRRLLDLVFITAAILFPLATATGNWPLAVAAGPVLLAAWITILRRNANEQQDGPQKPLDDHRPPLWRRVLAGLPGVRLDRDHR